DGNNVGMLEGSRRLRFAIETLQQGWAVGYIGLDLFQRDQPIYDRVASLIHDAHGAAAQLLEHLVFAHLLQITPQPCGTNTRIALDGSARNFAGKKCDGRTPTEDSKVQAARESGRVSWVLPARPNLRNQLESALCRDFPPSQSGRWHSPKIGRVFQLNPKATCGNASHLLR